MGANFIIIIIILVCNFYTDYDILGHKAFLGFFYLDYAYNNAVMHVFIENLKDSLDGNLSTPSSSGSTGMEEESDRIATHRFPPSSKS